MSGVVRSGQQSKGETNKEQCGPPPVVGSTDSGNPQHHRSDVTGSRSRPLFASGRWRTRVRHELHKLTSLDDVIIVDREPQAVVAQLCHLAIDIPKPSTDAVHTYRSQGRQLS